MKVSGKRRFLKTAVIMAIMCLVGVLSVFGLTACGEIRYDHYVLTTSENDDGTLTVTACTVVKDKEIVIPKEYKGKKIKALGDGEKAVFGGCEFSSLRIEGGVEEIADNACLNWVPLKTLTLEEGLIRIGANAFSGCSLLDNISVPMTVTSIGEGAFEDTGWYKKQPNGKIIYVGSFLYEYKGNMPSGTEIGPGVISEETKYISDYAFSGCIGLKSIVLPSHLEKIGTSSFAGCVSLESITIPASVKEVGSRAFSGCTLLSSVVIPSTIGTISPYMFYDCCGLTDITVADGITAVGASAFENCVGLTQIVLPVSVKTVGDAAFKNCVKLNKATVSMADEIGNDAFNNCIALSDYSLSSSVKTIGNNAFDNCVSITELTLPETVVSVGASAFNNCINLEKIIFAHKNSQGMVMGENAFTNCFRLTEVKIGSVADWCDISFGSSTANPLSQAGKLFVNDSIMTELNLPDGVTEIKDYAFINSGITKVTFPRSLVSVGAGAFAGCLKIKEQGVFGADEESWCAIAFSDEQSNPLYYGEKLFLREEEVKNLVIPESVKKIGSYAFCNDVSLRSVVIPGSVETVEGYAFSGCANLAAIEVKLGEQPEGWNADWADFVGTEVKDEGGKDKGTVITWTGKKEWKPNTNTIMAMVVGGILVVVALVLLVMWLIKKIKRKLHPQPAPEQKDEQTGSEVAASVSTEPAKEQIAEEPVKETEAVKEEEPATEEPAEETEPAKEETDSAQEDVKE